MEALPKKRQRPEDKIQAAIEDKLRKLQWFVKSTHGNIYQYGFPDLYLAHVKYGTRWLEVKNPDSYSFTPAQIITFPQMSAAGVGVWIATSELQVPDLLFTPPNWHMFLSIMRK